MRLRFRLWFLVREEGLPDPGPVDRGPHPGTEPENARRTRSALRRPPLPSSVQHRVQGRAGHRGDGQDSPPRCAPCARNRSWSRHAWPAAPGRPKCIFRGTGLGPKPENDSSPLSTHLHKQPEPLVRAAASATRKPRGNTTGSEGGRRTPSRTGYSRLQAIRQRPEAGRRREAKRRRPRENSWRVRR